MKIRSITCFYHPGAAFAEQTLDRLTALRRELKEHLEDAGYEVQSTRLVTVPFPELCPSGCFESGVNLAQGLESRAMEKGFDYLCLGPAQPNRLENYALIPGLIAETKHTFFSGAIAGPGYGISLPAIRACAKVIVEAAKITPNGFANLNFCASANVPAFGPFLPGAYSEGKEPAFALAMESADLAVEAFSQAGSLAEARAGLIERIEAHAEKIGLLAQALADQYQVAFKGFDFSLAPFPEQSCSIGYALEALGLPAIGKHGTLASAAFLASTLDEGSWPRAGYNGLMFPVLEDSTFAARAADGSLTVKDLLMVSAVCGTGLDTVPLAGDVTPEQLEAVLLDVAALSIRLNKPLTARLMPVPGHQAGDPTDFDFGFFAPGRIMALEAAPLQGVWKRDEDFRLTSRVK